MRRLSEYQSLYMTHGKKDTTMAWETIRKSSPVSKYEAFRERVICVAYPDGDLMLMRGAVERLGNATHVEVLRDGKSGVIGLRPTNAANPNGYKLVRDNHNSRLSCRELQDSAVCQPGFIMLWQGVMADNVLMFDINSSPVARFSYTRRSRKNVNGHNKE